MGARGDGERAVGACDVRVDSNPVVVGGEESSNNDAYGVYCAKDPASGISSKCTVLNNLDIVGSSQGFPPVAAGVRCDDGACARIEGNSRISSRSCNRCYGIILGNTGTFVARNAIEAGCGRVLAAGILSNDSFARIENNAIGGGRWTGGPGSVCGTGSMPMAPDVYGVLAVLRAGPNELDLHSNHVFAFGTATACTGRALGFDVTQPCISTPCVIPPTSPPTAPRGLVRNNILHAGFGTAVAACNTAYAVEEFAAAADPRIFEHNDLWYSGDAGVALYRDEGATNLATAAAVNALTDIQVSGVISADPTFRPGFNFPIFPATNPGNVPNVHLDLAAASACVDAGTASAAPVVDFYGNPRPASGAPDIGAHEQ
jgi:hypothetical protein